MYCVLLFCSINKNNGTFVSHIVIYQLHVSSLFLTARYFSFREKLHVIQPKLFAVNRCSSFQIQLGELHFNFQACLDLSVSKNYEG